MVFPEKVYVADQVACLDGESVWIKPLDTQHSQEWVRIIDEVNRVG